MQPHEEYLAFLSRLEPEICTIDQAAYYASAAVSLKRIADLLEKLVQDLKVLEIITPVAEDSAPPAQFL